MVHGFNTDVRYGTTVYHVQSEYKGGEKEPLIETRIYRGGEIVGTRRRSLADRRPGVTDDAALGAVMEEHHQDVIASVRGGSFEPAAPPSDDLAIDELALEFLAKRGLQE